MDGRGTGSPYIFSSLVSYFTGEKEPRRIEGRKQTSKKLRRTIERVRSWIARGMKVNCPEDLKKERKATAFMLRVGKSNQRGKRRGSGKIWGTGLSSLSGKLRFERTKKGNRWKSRCT